jgi:hypothetical protein
MTDRLGRADLHVHTLASDGTATVAEVLEAAEAAELDVVAITDHERIDAALAGRAMAAERGGRLGVVVGEEITTLGGHLLGLFIEEPIRPFRSLRTSIAEIHEQGGLAIPAHPLVPAVPLCAQGWALRRLLRDPDPRVRPDGLEVFNPTTVGRPGHRRSVEFARAHGLAMLGNSDAHTAAQVAQGHSTFPGRTPEDVRAAILAGTTRWHGEFHAHGSMVGTFGRQLRKYSQDARAELGGRIRRDGTGRDLGYPGGDRRPPRYDPLVERRGTER